MHLFVHWVAHLENEWTPKICVRRQNDGAKKKKTKTRWNGKLNSSVTKANNNNGWCFIYLDYLNVLLVNLNIERSEMTSLHGVIFKMVDHNRVILKHCSFLRHSCIEMAKIKNKLHNNDQAFHSIFRPCDRTLPL